MNREHRDTYNIEQGTEKNVKFNILARKTHTYFIRGDWSGVNRPSKLECLPTSEEKCAQQAQTGEEAGSQKGGSHLNLLSVLENRIQSS